MYQLTCSCERRFTDARMRLLRLRLRRLQLRLLLDVEADGEHVTVLHLVGLALEPLQAAPRRLRVALARDEVVPAHHLAADEAARNVGVDRRRGLECGLAPA